SSSRCGSSSKGDSGSEPSAGTRGQPLGRRVLGAAPLSLPRVLTQLLRKEHVRTFVFLAAMLLIGQTPSEPLSKTYRVTRANDVEFQKIEPFKVFDNVYYVGPGYVSVWLLTTPDGNILFDSAQEPYVDYVNGNIRKVGVDPKNIKYIILSHGHLDHFGGASKIQEA